MGDLTVYRNKDHIEKGFDDLQNKLDMKRLRIHTSAAMDGRIFVQFIALMYMSALRKKMRDTGLIDKYMSGNYYCKWKPFLKYVIPANTATS